MAKFPLLGRAWVYQERLLSPRIIHFTGYEMNFECFEGSTCPCDPNQHEPWPPKRALVQLRAAKSNVDTNKLDPAGRLSQPPSDTTSLDFWMSTVMAYSNLDLTYISDILPALSGVAKTVDKYRLDRYYAGLWSSSLMEGLLWYTTTPKHRPGQYLAPTWSWASLGPRSGISYWPQLKCDVYWASVEDVVCVL